MVKIENIAKEFLGDKVIISLPPRDEYAEEWELELILEEGDKLDLIDAIRRMETEPEKGKEILKDQDDVVRRIIERSYKDTLTEQQITSLLLNRSIEIILELSFKFGVRDRKAYDALLTKRNEEIKNLGESGLPEKETQ